MSERCLLRPDGIRATLLRVVLIVVSIVLKHTLIL